MNVYLTLQEFQIAMTSIVNNPPWKRTYASGDVLDLIYKEVNFLKFEVFKKVCDRLLGSSRSAPLVPDFQRAFSEMNLRRPSAYTTQQSQTSYSGKEDLLYHLEDNAWADNDYVFLRGPKPTFIIKRDSPNHHLVQLDARIGPAKRAEAEKAVKNRTYAEYLKFNTPTVSAKGNLTLMTYDDYKEAK